MMFINLLGTVCVLLCSIIPAIGHLSDDRHEQQHRDLTGVDATGVFLLGDSGHGYGYGNDNNGAYDYGYKEAERFWNNNNNGRIYTCTTVYPRFWLDVKKKVFDKCEDKWDAGGLWNDSIEDCMDGARDFALEKIGDCATTEFCYQMGIGAAASVAGTFCRKESLYREREWLPEECEQHSTTTCQADVVNLVEEFIEDNVCGFYDDSAMDYIDELYQLCIEEIEEMENEVNLD